MQLREPPLWMTAFDVIISKLFWVTAIGWVIFSCFYGYSGELKYFRKEKFWWFYRCRRTLFLMPGNIMCEEEEFPLVSTGSANATWKTFRWAVEFRIMKNSPFSAFNLQLASRPKEQILFSSLIIQQSKRTFDDLCSLM